MRVATALRAIKRGADNHMASGTQRPQPSRSSVELVIQATTGDVTVESRLGASPAGDAT